MGKGKKAREEKLEKKGRGGEPAKDSQKTKTVTTTSASKEETTEEGTTTNEADTELTLLDVIWPKKEGLTLIKWYVRVLITRDERTPIDADAI